MKNHLFLLTFLFFAKITFAQVAVNTTGASADPSSIMDVSSTTKGLLVPRMTETQKNQIASPSNGLMVFQTDGTSGFYYFESNTNSWKTMVNDAATSSNTNPNGGWGDCSIYNIDSYQPVADPNGKVNDFMAVAVAISGNYAIVGNSGDDEGGLTDNGSATIFKLNSTTGAWESQVKLTNPNAANNDVFGGAVAISGDYAIVGAIYDDEGGFTHNGSATIFKRNTTSGAWESQGKLLNPNPATDDWFGISVSISGDYAIVGASHDSEGGVSGGGSATVFKRNAGTGIWESQGKVTNPNAAQGDQFGITVSISGDYAIVGALTDTENNIDFSGSATIFKRNAGTGIWESQGKMTELYPVDGNSFGNAVSIYGDWAVVGVSRADYTNNATDGGLIYIYKRNTTTGVWEVYGTFGNIQAANGDNFGNSVSITDNYILVGARYEDKNGLNGVGSATIFKRIENIWVTHQKFSMPIPMENGSFGNAVAIDGTTGRFIVGADGVASQRGMAFFGKAK
jgi:FG-GAP repeat